VLWYSFFARAFITFFRKTLIATVNKDAAMVNPIAVQRGISMNRREEVEELPIA
jgi:hypothetical protein